MQFSTVRLHLLFGNTAEDFLDVVPSRAATGSVSRAADLHYVVLPPEITTGRVSPPLIIDQFKVLYDCTCTPYITCIWRNRLTLTRQRSPRGSERDIFQ
jgi:hypothetical protein